MIVSEPSKVSCVIRRLRSDWTKRLFSHTKATRLPSGENVANISVEGSALPPSLANSPLSRSNTQ